MADKFDLNEYSQTMAIPERYRNDVASLLMRLSLGEEKKEKEEKKKDDMDTEDDSEECQVIKVFDHTFDKFGLWWHLEFKGGIYEWVLDKHCNCERLIQEYLERSAHKFSQDTAKKTKRKQAPNKKIRTVHCICRVSSKNQTGLTHVSLDVQEEQLRETAHMLEMGDCFVRHKFHEIVGSAYKGIPTILKELGEYAREDDVVIVYRVDRLSRNIFESIKFMEDLNDRGVLVYSQEEGIWYHERRLDFIQHILNANKEGALISRRVQNSVDYRKKRGDFFGAPPYGYVTVRDPDTKQIYLKRNDSEQKVITKIKKIRHKAFSEMANKLNEEGTYKRSSCWTAAKVKLVYEQVNSRYFQRVEAKPTFRKN